MPSIYTYWNTDPNFTCDGCGKFRRTLYAAAVNPWDDIVEVVLCFFCVKQGERDHIKHLNDLYEKGEIY